MATFPRYAIYYAAAAGSDLDRFGAQLLGYDALSGTDLPFPDDVIKTVPDWRELTRDPRKYGFHATLKAPLPLAHGKTETELLGACDIFARTARPLPVITPVVDSISGFIAVVPAEPPAELIRLAADCVREFDGFRAPLSPEDRMSRPTACLRSSAADGSAWRSKCPPGSRSLSSASTGSDGFGNGSFATTTGARRPAAWSATTAAGRS